MNIISSLRELLNNEQIKNLLFSLFNSQPQNSSKVNTQNTNYYELPNYSLNSTQVPKNTPISPPQNSQLNLETIIKIAGILLQFLGNKNKKDEPKAIQQTNTSPSKIEQLRRVE